MTEATTTTTTTTTTLPFRPFSGLEDTNSPLANTIVPDSGYFGNTWPAKGAIPKSFSSAGWTSQAQNIAQQTFLGASIRSFNMNGGFGDTSSTLTVELVNDEYNLSDKTNAGLGDDVYHSGLWDRFAPPVVGSPVFFKFGNNFATIEEAYRKTYDDLYGFTTIVNDSKNIPSGPFNPLNFTSLGNNQIVDLSYNPSGSYVTNRCVNNTYCKGKDHLVFGGILQSYVENRGPGGSPLYSVQVIDPREILSNVVLVLNNYAGTTYNSQNLLNVYGFLEHNASDATLNDISGSLPYMSVLTKDVSVGGFVSYSGNDTYYSLNTWPSFSPNTLNKSFPITGTGYSRRGQHGLPYYRLKQAVNALIGYNGELPSEYRNKSFGGSINFRGYRYVVDFGSLPDLPDLYYFDFDQINLLDLALEICDITSKDLFVTLLPVINHPAQSFLYSANQYYSTSNQLDKMIAGIIRLDAIDRSKPPLYGAIKNYIDSLASSGIYVENQDVGFELSNITTDKFVVGAQEVDMYCFSSNADRNRLNKDSQGSQWLLETSLKQQILPYYGLLGKNAVTIPKGFGAYQQILLDATSLNANGVGSYYVATEMELRCALISFERWKEFLKMYNDIYLESIELDDSEDSANLLSSVNPGGNTPPIDDISNNYAVTVPRSVFNTYAPYDKQFTPSGKLPYSPCNPPYGYPLYYKRMTQIGIPEGGLTDIQTRFTSILTGLGKLKSSDKSNFRHIINSEFARLRDLSENSGLSVFEQGYFDEIEALLNNAIDEDDVTKALVLIEEAVENFKPVFFSPDLTKLAKKNTQNALKVYNFVRGVAEECLGKKFLVKIPKKVNTFYNTKIVSRDPHIKEYIEGPFGFKPRPHTSGINDEFSLSFYNNVLNNRPSLNNESFISEFLSINLNHYSNMYAGALNVNYNPISDRHEFSYYPSNEGGFFNFDLCSHALSASGIKKLNDNKYTYLPLGIQQQLIPIDLTNFITDNGRITPYVRFDHSEHLSFDGFNASDFSQQIITSEGMVPDLSEDLDNVNGDTFHKFPDPVNANDNTPPIIPQVAFVKCTIDDKLYMPPKTSYQFTHVHAQNPIATKRKTPPRKIYQPCEDKFVDSFSYYKSHFVPDTTPGTRVNILDFNASSGIQIAGITLEGSLINTDMRDLDTNHIYALITLPGRVIPTKDARFRDGPFQSSNAERFKHFMTMDTVTGLTGFEKPSALGAPSKNILKQFDCQTILPDTRVQSYAAAKKANDSVLSFGFPQTLNATMPSPVYPDLAILPLMSQERCYGPWVSSQIDTQAALFTNIGGRIEFVKDENLSPWNYSGYDLMHKAGMLQAQFAQSLLLASERGGFVVPSVPYGCSLGKALLNAGPLVTNIQVDISEAGVKTTYRLDSYTSSFGKLQKQKQDQITTISRERQKLRDERNSLIRKGLGKNQNRTNYSQQYQQLQNGINNSVLNGGMTSISQGTSSALTTISLTSKKYTSRRWSSEIDEHYRSDFVVDGSILPHGAIGEVMQNYIGEDGLAQSYANSAAAQVTDLYTPASNDPFHPNMPSRPEPFTQAHRSLYFDENTPFTEQDIT